MKKKAMLAVLMMSMAVGSSLTVCAAPETKADGTVFDAEYYAQMYPDVVAALGTDADALYQHYMNFGKAEGRLASASSNTVGTAQQAKADGTVFDAEYYAQMYPDVAAAFGTDADALYNHYMTYGKAEGRLANSGAVPAQAQEQAPPPDKYYLSDGSVLIAPINPYTGLPMRPGESYIDVDGVEVGFIIFNEDEWK